MRSWIAVAVIAVLAACGGEQAPPDMKDPVSVARAFVDAYNGKDLARMLPLVDQVNMEAIKDALADGPDSTAWQGIFAPEMVQLIAREGGKVDGPRYEGRDAVVGVAKSDLGDVFTVELSQREDGDWLIVENAILSEQEFAELPTEPKKQR
jgi:hypothetical protein